MPTPLPPARRRPALLVAAVVAAAGACARGAEAQGVVRGTVYDSLFRRGPLAGADVWIDGAPLSAATDASGRFTLAGVPAGRHRVTFSHPAFDRVGVGAPVREVTVADGATVDVVLAAPSATTVYAALCPGGAEVNTGVLVGRVSAPGAGDDPAPASGVRTVAAWSAITLAGTGLVRAERTAEGRSDAAGRFRLCGVPNDVPVQLRAEASDGAVALATVDLRGEAVGAAAVRLPGAGTGGGEATAGVTGGSVTAVAGTVRRADGRPAAGARVSVAGVSAAAGDNGAFVLRGVPAGEQVLEARLLGAGPAATRLTLGAGRTTQVAVTLGEQVAVLAPTTVRESGGPAGIAGFEQRRRAGGGHFVTAEDMQRRGVVSVYDALLGVPGLTVTASAYAGSMPVIRNTRAQATLGVTAGGCYPLLYLDGVRVTENTSPEVGVTGDVGLVPNELYGIEVYLNLASAPPQYQALNSGCGVILIWTRRALGSP